MPQRELTDPEARFVLDENVLISILPPSIRGIRIPPHTRKILAQLLGIEGVGGRVADVTIPVGLRILQMSRRWQRLSGLLGNLSRLLGNRPSAAGGRGLE